MPADGSFGTNHPKGLNELSRQGKINKVHGGAMLPEGEFESQEQDVHTKEGIQVEQKERIARYAAKQVCDDDFVFIRRGNHDLKDGRLFKRK